MPADLSKPAHERIRALVQTNPVVLFMKGSPDFPQCGFSALACSLLSRHVSAFSSADVLADPELRQGLKEYSDWPTFPQLYCQGAFVGGSDILREMDEAGELGPLLLASAKSS